MSPSLVLGADASRCIGDRSLAIRVIHLGEYRDEVATTHLPRRYLRADMRGGTGGEHEMQYQLVIRGQLDARYLYLFEPLHVERTSGTTMLEGPVVDQAQLHGFIERIEELGLELVSVERTDVNSE